MAYFGNHATSSNYRNTARNTMRGSRFTAAEDGTATEIGFNGKSASGSKNVRFFICNSSKQVIGQTDPVTISTTQQDYSASLQSPVSLVSGNAYYLMVMADAVTVYTIYFYYSATGGSNVSLNDTSNSYSSPTDPTDGADEADLFCIWAVYTAGGAEKSVTDTGSGSDSLQQLIASLSLSDIGAGADQFGGQAQLSLPDSASGTDAVHQVQVTISVTDTASGAELLSLSASVQVTDTWSGMDALNLLTATLISIWESGYGSDQVPAVTCALSILDTGTGADACSINIQLAISDSGMSDDAISAFQAAMIAVADLAAGYDAIGPVDVRMMVADSAAAVDLIAGLQAILRIIDAAGGTDVALRIDQAARIVSIRFNLRRRSITGGLAAKSADFSLRSMAVTINFEGGSNA